MTISPLKFKIISLILLTGDLYSGNCACTDGTNFSKFSLDAGVT